MLVAPRISECFGVPWSAVVCLGCCWFGCWVVPLIWVPPGVHRRKSTIYTNLWLTLIFNTVLSQFAKKNNNKAWTQHLVQRMTKSVYPDFRVSFIKIKISAENQFSALFPGKRAEIYFRLVSALFPGKRAEIKKSALGKDAQTVGQFFSLPFLYLMLAFFLLNLLILDLSPPQWVNPGTFNELPMWDL